MNRALVTRKPTKMWIDGKCFQIQRSNNWRKNEDPNLENSNSTNYDYSTNSEGKLLTSFRLPQAYYYKMLRFPHLNLKQLEINTRTRIALEKDGSVTIMGEDEKKIAEARDEIQAIVSELRDSATALQFISIPTCSDEIMQNFNQFKTNILNEGKIDGMEESIFPSPFKLHLTVVVFALFDDREISEATKALQDYKKLILNPLIQEKGPIKIRVAGINYMNDNLKKVHVLYGNARIVEENEDFNLQKLVNGLSDHFYDRGLVRTYKDNVKLHMTLINTKYRKLSENQQKKRWPKKISFDATTIMEKYKDFYFGESDLNSIQLSLMGSVGDDGFYKQISAIDTN